jgi:mutator protein MutT
MCRFFRGNVELMCRSDSTFQTVGIAVVDDGGRYLVGVRPADQPLAGMHEFPGGKCRPGESPRDCAARECLEETGLAVRPERELHRTTHTYPHAVVELHFWLCRPDPCCERRSDHNGYEWVPAERLPELRFPEANAAVIELLAGDPITPSPRPGKDRAEN